MAIMAMIGASVIHPGVYFAMNSVGGVDRHHGREAAQVISIWGFVVTPAEIDPDGKRRRRNDIISRTGGAPTLGGRAWRSILSSFLGGGTLMGIWYHFAILFEALFILTTVDAGTRVLRFMIQDLVGNAMPAFKETTSWTNNLIGSALCGRCCGGIFSTRRHRSVRRHLDTVAAVRHRQPDARRHRAHVCTVVLFKMKRERYALVTAAPATWLVLCTTTAGLEKVFSPNPNVGFLSHAWKYGDALAAGQLLAPAKSAAEMRRIVLNDYIDAALAAAFVCVVVATVVYAVMSIWKALGNPRSTAEKWGLPTRWREAAMPDLQSLFDRSATAAGSAAYWTTRTARLMIGVPDYETYVAHRRTNHPQEPIMSTSNFFANASRPAMP